MVVPEREQSKLAAGAQMVRKSVENKAVIFDGDDGCSEEDCQNGEQKENGFDIGRKNRLVVNHAEWFLCEMERFGKLLTKNNEAQTKLEERKLEA